MNPARRQRGLLTATLAALLALALIGPQLSPWPSALAIRLVFDRNGERIAQALEPQVPAGVQVRLDLVYDPDDPDARLDVFAPETTSPAPRPALVWVHGGGWLAGDKSQLANYLKILAARGYVTVGVNYPLAPGANYPTPVFQVNRALGWLDQHAEELGIDRGRILLAGDSAGAQIAGQLANLISAPEYAAGMDFRPAIHRQQLRGLLLYCGAYDIDMARFEGNAGRFVTAVLWAYFGRRDYRDDPRVRQFSVLGNLSAQLPPLFVSVGNADPLAPQSKALAARAMQLGVPVDVLFFPDDHRPALEHEYQFDLDGEAGQLALQRSLAFLDRHSAVGAAFGPDPAR